MRTPYNVPLGLSNKSIIKGTAMFETFEPAITQPFNKVFVYDALVYIFGMILDCRQSVFSLEIQPVMRGDPLA